MPWGLGVVDGSSADGWQFRIVQRLSDAEVARYNEAIGVLLRFNPERHPFGLVQLSYEQYREKVDEFAAAFASGPPRPSPALALFEITAKLVEWLSCSRRFLAQVETDLKQRYGRRSTEWGNFEAARQREYAGSASYRFMYKLRDYSDHCGPPLGKLNFTQQYDDHGQPVSVFQVFFNRDSLLQKFNRWDIVEKDLRQWPEFIEVGPHMDRAMRSLDTLVLELAKMEAPAMIAEAEFVERFVAPVAKSPGEPHIFYEELSSHQPAQPVPPMRLIRVPMEFVEHVLRFREDRAS